MKRVLLVGYDPRTVDYSDPALPPGITAEKIEAGIKIALRQMVDRGWEAEACYIRPDKAAGQTVERQLASKSYDCVVIGAGVRLPPKSLAEGAMLAEVGPLLHQPAPESRIIRSIAQEDGETTEQAVARWEAEHPGEAALDEQHDFIILRSIVSPYSKGAQT